MKQADQVLLVMTNVPDEKTGEMIARHVVEHRLAACVNCLPGVRSIYRWQEIIEDAKESSLLIKTTAACYTDLEAAIKSLHPYDVPEIIALPITHGLPTYLDWIMSETKKE